MKVFVMLIGLGIAPAMGQPISVVDSIGATVTVPAPPTRIVTVFSSNTELVSALEMSDRIVGIDAMTYYPPVVMDRPRVSGRLGFSIDAIVAQAPDLVLLSPSSARQAAFALYEPLRRIGIPTMVTGSTTVAEIISNIRKVGIIGGVPEKGKALAQILETRISAVQARLKGPRPRVVMITGRVGNGLLLVARPNTYTGDALRLAGGDFAFGSSLGIPQVSPEAILAADPDVILFAGTQKDFDALLGSPGWEQARAVRNKRMGIVSRSEFSIPGPRTIAGIEALSAILYPDATQ